MLNGYSREYGAAVKLAKLHPALATPAFRERWKEKFLAQLATPAFSVGQDRLRDFIALGSMLGATEQPKFGQTILKGIENPGDRIEVLQTLESEAAKNAKIKPIFDAAKTKFATYKNLTPSEEVMSALIAKPRQRTDALTQAVARALAQDPNFAPQAVAVLKGGPAFALGAIEDSLYYISQNLAAYPKLDTLALWRALEPSVGKIKGYEKILGLCIDTAIAQGNKPAWRLAEEIGTLELPEDREIDTIRALWYYAKSESLPPAAAGAAVRETNKYQFFSNTIGKLLYEKLAQTATAKDALDHGTRAKKLKQIFLQFFSESVSPPEAMLGFSSINQIKQITKNYSVLLLPESPTADFQVDADGQKFTLPARAVGPILKESVSTYYLFQLRNAFEHEKDATKKAAIQKTLKTIVESYKDYVINHLAATLRDPVASEMIAERFKWNKREDLAGLIAMLAGTDADRGRRQKLLDAAMMVKAKFPGMNDQIPADLVDPANPRRAHPFWESLSK